MTKTLQAWAGQSLDKATDQAFVWMHGWGQTRQSLLRLADLLADVGQHQLYDLPGFGETPITDPAWGTADYGAALIPQLPEKPCILVGHSFGARVAIRAAYSHPDRIKALILIGGAGLRPKRGPYQIMRAFILRMGSRLAGLMDKCFASDIKSYYGARFGSRDYQAAGALRTTLVKTVTEDLGPLAAEIRCPVLLITGSDDQETPPYMAQRYHGFFANSRVHIVQGFGHLDILSRGVYQCDSLIRPFLEDI